MTRSFTVEAQSAAGPETVFDVLADVTRWQEWAGPAVPRSSWAQGAPAGGLGAVRKLGLGPLSSREEIVEFERPRRLGYVLRSGEVLHHYRATVELHEGPEGGTRIVWSGTVDSRVPGASRALALFFRTLVAGFAMRLARQAERPASAD